ncbi:hypothetical protein C8T65DRAFT_172407 [Cerioporus squamosus]|nr:hypothetical protein C8T65DRAFT_172407 [Cerioporus squamosus]
MALALLLAGLALRVSRLLFVKAQYTLAECDSTTEDYTWMENSKGHSPCLVAAYLLVPCVGPVSVPRLDPVQMPAYIGPLEQTEACGCNSVMYSLLEACQTCQADGSVDLLSWLEYSTNCTDPVLLSYPNPIPSGTAIPAWAFQDVTTLNVFDVAEAELTGDTPESTASPPASTSTTSTFSAALGATATLPSSSSSSTTTSSTSPSFTTGAPAESGDGHRKSSNVGAIVGGVVGGVLGFLSLGSAIVYMLLRQRKLDRKAEAQASGRPMSTVTDVDGPSEKPMSIMSVPSMIYDPDDPRTFPSVTDPSPLDTRAASPTPSIPPGPVAGHMHSFSALQNYTTSGYNGSEHVCGYAGSMYRGTPEV